MISTPLLVSGLRDVPKYLKRIESTTNDDKNEDWLQNILFNNPTLIPVDEFDIGYSPLIPLAREVSCSTGNIDIIYLSSNGSLILVETKLWKNPEKHRTVVAQIIDYAKELSNWDYSDLDKAVSNKSVNNYNIRQIIEDFYQKRGDNFQKTSGMDYIEFQERIMKCLLNGEFLLIIAGDRISANVALLSESIQGAPGLDFRMGLVEYQFYLINEESYWPLLIIPDIVGRTVEVTRGVIKVQYEEKRPKIFVETSLAQQVNDSKGKTTPDIFLQSLPDNLRNVFDRWLNIWTCNNYILYWGTKGFSLRIILPSQSKPVTILLAYPDAIGLFTDADRQKLGISVNLFDAYLSEISKVPQARHTLNQDKRYISLNNIDEQEVDTIFQAISDLIKNIVNI